MLLDKVDSLEKELKELKAFQKRLDHIIDKADVIEEALKMYTDTESRKAAKFDRKNRHFF